MLGTRRKGPRRTVQNGEVGGRERKTVVLWKKGEEGHRERLEGGKGEPSQAINHSVTSTPH